MAESKSERQRGRPRTVDRAATIKAALEAYWHDGLHGMSVNEICRRAEISKPSLYREFGGEDGLMDAVLESYRELVIVSILSRLAPDRPFGEVLEELITAHTQERETPPGCLLAEMRYAPSRLGPETGSRADEIRKEMTGAYREWYKGAQARGEVNPYVSAELAAYVIDMQLTNVLIQMALGEPPELVREQARLSLAGLLKS